MVHPDMVMIRPMEECGTVVLAMEEWVMVVHHEMMVMLPMGLTNLFCAATAAPDCCDLGCCCC